MAMTSLKEFEQRFSEATGEEPGTVRYSARRLQEADLIPTGKRGGLNSPELTPEHGAMFALGFYGAKATPKRTAQITQGFSTIQREKDGPTLLEDMAELIRCYAGQEGRFSDIRIQRILFITWEDWPEVEVEWTSLSDKKRGVWSYIPTEDSRPPNFAEAIPATVVYGTFLKAIADALGLGDDDG